MHDPRSLRSQSDENTARWLCEHYPTIAAQDGTNPLFRLLAKYITPIKGDPDDQ